MQVHKWILATSFLVVSNVAGAFAEEQFESSKVQDAVNTVKALCLSGSQLDIEADVKGNITFKRFMPGGEGSFSVNVREADGATAILNEELRMIADDTIRECTQTHIARIVDAIFAVNPPGQSSSSAEVGGRTIGSATFLGFVPEEIVKNGMVSGKNGWQFFRFSLATVADVEVYFDKQSQCMNWRLHTPDGNVLGGESDCPGGTPDRLVRYLVPGDYFVSIETSREEQSSVYRMKVATVPGDY